MAGATEGVGGAAGGASIGSGGDIAVGKYRSCAFIQLTRPGQLNAIDDAMRQTIAAALGGWIRDPDIYALRIQSASPKVFSAGGDLRELARLAVDDPAALRRTFAAEYRLNWSLECFAKPTVSLIDGLVVGSGVGLTQYGTHRVAGEGYAFAMPETAIGLFPDVGVISVLARMPRAIGAYLALTGRRVGRPDAFRLGLVTHCLASGEFEAVAAALADADPVDLLLDGRHRDPGPGELVTIEGPIEEVFSAPTLGSIMERLAALSAKGGAAGEWAAGVRAELQALSPLGLIVTLEHLRRVGGESLRETLIRDYRLACRMALAHDFREGVRAMVIDKDRNPRWQPASIAAVESEAVEALFAPLADGDELVLPSREQLQDLRSGA